MTPRLWEPVHRLPDAARSTWRRWGNLKKTLAVLVVLALAGGAACGLYRWSSPDLSCGPGVWRPQEGAECVGVSDGRHSFADLLDDVSARIAAQNRRAEGRPHVTLALMLPMTAREPFERRKILEQVQGAYLAQYRANEQSNDQTPKIRLLLANPGRNHRHWEDVAEELVRRAASAENLRAVIGFDVSVQATRDAIRFLTVERGVPVVAGPVTAEDIGPYSGFARIVPTTRDQANALASFDKDVDPRTTLVIEDQRSGDNYITQLRTAFRRLAHDAPRAPEVYESPADINAEGSTSNDFRQMVNSICISSARTLYFAGRPVQLRQFVNELGDRPCVEKSYRVVTGSGASTIISDPKLDWSALTRGVTVQYAAVAHPDAWTGPRAPRVGGSPAAYRKLTALTDRAGGPPVGPIGRIGLADSRTIIAYDAALTAITAIRNSATRQQAIPSLDQIRKAWLRLHGPNKVDGASGWICLDNHGNPYNKAVSVVQLNPATESLDFVGLAWPRNKPPAADCTATDDRR